MHGAANTLVRLNIIKKERIGEQSKTGEHLWRYGKAAWCQTKNILNQKLSTAMQAGGIGNFGAVGARCT